MNNSRFPMTRSMLSPEKVDMFVRLSADVDRRRAQVAAEAPTEAIYDERRVKTDVEAPAAPKRRKAARRG